MITSAHTQLLVHALGHMSRMSGNSREIELGKMRLRALELQLNSQRDALDTQADIFRTLIHAMVERRLDAVQNGFSQTMTLYADQARHFMSQQERVVDAQIRSKDPLERAGYQSRATEIDIQLKRIRSDAAKLYKEMTRAILIIGGMMPSLPTVDRSSLMIP